jgi:hypothetical protein
VFVWPDLKISEREKTLWASRRKSSVEINISREKEFIILIIKNILERVSGFFTNWIQLLVKSSTKDIFLSKKLFNAGFKCCF